MKQETLVTRLTMLLLFLGLAAYFALYTYQSLTDPFSSALCYTYTVDETVETTGYVVRAERVLPVQNGVVDILPEEGEKVAAGETVAVVYQDSAALEEKLAIRQLEWEREQLEYALRQDSGQGDVARLDQDILTALLQLRADTAAGDFSRLEENAMELKSMVFYRGYTYSGSAQSVEGIKTLLEQVQEQLRARKRSAARGTVQVTAPEPGIYSGQVDGYEQVLTVDALDQLTPGGLADLQALPVADEGQAGKLITSSRWYFVTVLDQADAARLKQGQSLTLRFSRDRAGEAAMEVERIGAAEDGRQIVILSSDRQLSAVTLLRRQTVELVLNSTTGIRVPKAALRVEEKTTVDESGGESVTEQSVVYAVVGMQAERKPVRILAEEEDYFLVEAEPVDNPQNTAELKRSLRSGDEIIVTAWDLYDGKVVK